MMGWTAVVAVCWGLGGGPCEAVTIGPERTYCEAVRSVRRLAREVRADGAVTVYPLYAGPADRRPTDVRCVEEGPR
mgnify:FL=1